MGCCLGRGALGLHWMEKSRGTPHEYVEPGGHSTFSVAPVEDWEIMDRSQEY